MKKLLIASLSLLFVFAFVGCKHEEKEVTDPNADVFTVKLEAKEDVVLSSVEAKLCDEEGEEVGTATLHAGNNTLSKEGLPYYIVCSVPAEYDCPVIYADGNAAATVSVQKAEQEGAYTFTAFAKNADKTKNYIMQMCINDSCNMPALLDESGTKFSAVIKYNETYEFKIVLDGTNIFEYPCPFTAEHRFTVVDLAE